MVLPGSVKLEEERK